MLNVRFTLPDVQLGFSSDRVPWISPWHLHCLGRYGGDERIFCVQANAPPLRVWCAQETTRNGERQEEICWKRKSETKHINYALWSNKQATTRQSTTMTTPSANIKRVAATPATAHLHGGLSSSVFFFFEFSIVRLDTDTLDERTTTLKLILCAMFLHIVFT